MRAIYKKELKAYFSSMIGWIFMAVNLFFAGWYFKYNGMENGYPYISYVLSGIMIIFICSLPFLTMKSFAEESRQKTDQLLYTAPIPIWKIVLGKYLAICTLVAIVIFFIGLYPLVLLIYGAVPFVENLIALLGFLFFGMTCVAVGIFLSSLTDNPIIAAVLTFFVLLLGLMIPSINMMINPAGNKITNILSFFDLTKYLDYNLYGELYIPTILYYLSVILLSLYLTGFFIAKKRWTVKTHGIAKLIGSATGLIGVVIVTILVNVLTQMLPDEYIVKDLTYNKIYSISESSKNILNHLNGDVTAYVLCKEQDKDITIDATLKCMAEANAKFHVSYISPEDNPYFYANYSDSEPASNSLIISCNDKYKVIDYFDLYEFEYEYDFDLYSGNYIVKDYSVVGYDGEGQIMAAIDYVTNEISPKIYLSVGHDEVELGDSLIDTINKANVVTEGIDLFANDEIPEDAACLFILGPLSDLTPDEVAKVNSYLHSGGNAIFVVAYTDADELTNYYSILEQYGIEVQNGLVMEQGTSFYKSEQYCLLPDILNTDYTEGIYTTGRNKYVIMPYAKGMLLDRNSDAEHEIFFRTTENAYCQEDGVDTEIAGVDCNQYALGVTATKNFNGKNSKIVVISSDYYLYDDVNSYVGGNNFTVFMKAVSDLVGLEGKSSVPAKKYSYDSIILDETAKVIFSIFIIGIIPLTFIFTGGILWYGRRKNRNISFK